jgi:hypothetical protein
MAAELAGENPSTARLLCAQAVAIAHAEHWMVTMQAASHGMQQDHYPKSIRKRNAAHKRLMTWLKTLAQITAAEQRKQRMTFNVIKNRESILAGSGGMAELFAQIGTNNPR